MDVAYAGSIERLKALVLESVTSPESKRNYGRGIDRFLTWFQTEQRSDGFTEATVKGFKAHLIESGLSSSAINLYLTPIRRLAAEAAESGLMVPEMASAICRVKGLGREPRRIGTPLIMFDAEKLITTPDTATLKGKRDRALLAVLIGCGLRREEVASLTVEHLWRQGTRWVMCGVVGKGRKVRSVPIPSRVKAAIDGWLKAAAIRNGRIFRAVNKGDRVVGDGMTAQSIFETVRKYAIQSRFEHVGPNDLRRMHVRLLQKDPAALEQIRF